MVRNAMIGIYVATLWAGVALGQVAERSSQPQNRPTIYSPRSEQRGGAMTSSQWKQDSENPSQDPSKKEEESAGDKAEDEEDTEEEDSSESDDDEIDFSRDKLTGNWRGRRDALAEAGLTIDFDGTYVFQGVTGGGRVGPLFDLFSDEGDSGNTFAGDLQLELDTEKAGLWPQGIFRFRVDSRAGRSVVVRAGSVSAVNNEALFPNVVDQFDEEAIAITEWTYEHSLSETVSLYGGLLNTAEGDENGIAGYALSSAHFLNSALLYSLVEDASVPNTSLGAGIFYEPSESVSGSFSVFGTTETAGEDPFENWNGTTFSTEWYFGHELHSRPGGQTFGLLYGIDARRIDIAANPRIVIGSILLGIPVPSTDDDTWAFYYNAHQYLVGDDEGGWGIFGRWGISDGNPNFVHWNAALGFGGTGMFASRPDDRWGLGTFYISMSDEDLLQGLRVGDEVGGEYFYNIALRPWFHVTLDAQVINSALPNVDVTTVLGIRTHVNF